MKYILSLNFLFLFSYLFSQTEPTIGVCAGGSFVICLHDSTYELCTRINVSNPRPIDSFVIKWSTDGPSKTIIGSNKPPDQRFIYNFSSFYNSSCDIIDKDVSVTLFTYYPDTPRANNSFLITFQKPPRPSFNIGGKFCVGETIFFTNVPCPSNVKVKEWNYGDGITDKIGTHVYTKAGSYEVTMTAGNQCESAIAKQTINIVGLPTAIADINSGATIYLDTFEVCLNNTGTVELDGSKSLNANSYVWKSTTSPSTGWNWITRNDTIKPRLNFTGEGIYKISLTTDNLCNKQATTNVFFRVIPTLTLPKQNDTCYTFKYIIRNPVYRATYEYFFNGVSQGYFSPFLGFTTQIGENVVVARSGGNCLQEIRDTFNVELAKKIKFTLPTKDTIVCPKTGFIPVMFSGGTPSNNLIQQGNNYFFDTNTAKPGSTNVIIIKGTCGVSDTVAIKVRDTISVRLNNINSICQGATYIPTPIIQTGIYALNGQPFQGSIRIDSVGDYEVTLVVTDSCKSNTLRQKFSVIGLPTAVVEVNSGATLIRDTFEVCLTKTGIVELNASKSLNTNLYSWAVNRTTGWNWLTRTDISRQIMFTQEGVYNVTLTTNSSCNKPATSNLVFRVIPILNLPIQKDTCRSFTYSIKNPVTGAMYEYFFNGIYQGFFSPVSGFTANIGSYVIVARIGGNCVQEFRDTFKVAPATVIKFTLPMNDTLVCPKSGLIPVAFSGGTPSNNLIRQGNNYFFNTNTAQPGSANLISITGACGVGDKIIIKVRDTIPVQLDNINSRCQGFTYKPTPIVPTGIYTINGQSFRDSIRIDSVGDYEVMLVVTDSCNSDTLRRKFNISGVASIQMFSRDTVTCFQGDKIILRANPLSGKWSGKGVSENIFDPKVAGTGAQVLIFSAGLGECANTKSINIKIGGLSNIDAGKDIILCNSQQVPPFKLPTGQPVGGVFRLNNTLGQIITQIDPASFPAFAKVFYVVQDTLCTSYDSLTVTINSISTAEFVAPVMACVGLPIKLSVINPASGLTFRVFVNDTLKSIFQPVNYTFQHDGTMRVGVEVRNAAQCLDTLWRNVSVKRPPSALVSVSENSLCHGQNATIRNDISHNDSTTSYVWTFRNQIFKEEQITPFGMSNIGCADSIYKLQLTASTGVCSAVTSELNLTVHPKIKAMSGIQGADSICSNQLVSFFNTSCGNLTEQTWRIGSKLYKTITPPDLRFENRSDTILQIPIQHVVKGDCSSDTSAFFLWVYPPVIKSHFSFGQKVGCQPMTINLKSQTLLAKSLLWIFSDGTTSTDAALSKTIETSGIFRMRLRVFDFCGGYDDITDSITVLPSPKTNGLTYEKTDVCNETSIRIKPNIVNGTLGRVWVDGFNLSDSSLNPILLFPQAGNYWVKYEAIHPISGCKIIDSGLVVIHAPFKLTTLVFPDSCGNSNGAVNLIATGGAGSYKFTKGDTSNWQTSKEFRGLVYNTVYNFFVRDSSGCLLSENISMPGNISLGINVGADTAVRLCDTLSRQISTNFSVAFIEWKFESGEGTINTPNTLKVTIFPIKSSQIYVKVRNKSGCEVAGRFKINVDETFQYYVPNSFSPNGDGINDKFRPYFRFNNIRVLEFNVFTRWGALMHSAKNVLADNAVLEWDGNYKNDLVAADVYIWTLSIENCNGIMSFFSGDVTLVK